MTDRSSGLLIFTHVGDREAELAAFRLLEEGKWIELDKQWRARADKAHVPGMQPHTHVYLRRQELFVINRDGTPSHNSDLSTMPRHVRDLLRDKMLIEGRMDETASATPERLVPQEILDRAERRMTTIAILVERVRKLLDARRAKRGF